jgi:hypothetical protein
MVLATNLALRRGAPAHPRTATATSEPSSTATARGAGAAATHAPRRAFKPTRGGNDRQPGGCGCHRQPSCTRDGHAQSVAHRRRRQATAAGSVGVEGPDATGSTPDPQHPRQLLHRGHTGNRRGSRTGLKR